MQDIYQLCHHYPIGPTAETLTLMQGVTAVAGQASAEERLQLVGLLVEICGHAEGEMGDGFRKQSGGGGGLDGGRAGGRPRRSASQDAAFREAVRQLPGLGRAIAGGYFGDSEGEKTIGTAIRADDARASAANCILEFIEPLVCMCVCVCRGYGGSQESAELQSMSNRFSTLTDILTPPD